MYKGTTPTIIFSFSDFDPTTAAKVIVTFSNGGRQPFLEVETEDLEITASTISLWLSQEQSLQMPAGNVNVQINFLFEDGQRAATNIQSIPWTPNLHSEVMT